MRQALARAGDIPPAISLGAYTGRIGIVLSGVYIGRLFVDEGLIEQSLALLEPLEELAAETPEFDLLSGRAGAIVVLLILRELTGEPRLLGLAKQFGDDLLQRAEKTSTGYSWASPSFSTSGNLAGFSHGAAGAGFALLELFSATADNRYRVGTEEAFNYERHLFDAEAQNWPDLREHSGAWDEGGRRAFATLWCHGAPGIALSRLRAVELFGDETCRAEAIAALETTHRDVRSTLPTRLGNYSLCHGLAGNAEVLLYAREVLGPTSDRYRELAIEVANDGVRSFGSPGLPWPCGTFEGETAGLFLGLAGIGLFYLRLHNTAIPSVLILRRESFSKA